MTLIKSKETYKDDVSGKKFIKIINDTTKEEMFKFSQTGDSLSGIFLGSFQEGDFKCYRFKLEKDIVVRVPQYKELKELLFAELQDKEVKLVLDLFTSENKIFALYVPVETAKEFSI